MTETAQDLKEEFDEDILNLKSMRQHRRFSDYMAKTGYDITRDGEPLVSSPGWNSEIRAFLDSSTLKTLFFSEDWVFIVTDLIANKISSQIMQVMIETTVEGNQVTDFDINHPLNDLLARPNPWQDYHAFMYNVAVELYLMGNAIIWYNAREGRLLIIPAELVTLDFGDDGILRSYLMATNSTDLAGFMERQQMVSFPVEEVIHIKRPNPASLMWGLSPFVPGSRSILFNRYSGEYLNSFYIKQATPGMAIEMDRHVNEDIALRQLRSFEMAYTGRRNQRRTLILPKGVSAKPLSHTLADQKLVEQIDKNRETILGLLKVPKHELSLQTAGSLGSEEHKIALRNFWESTLIPGMRQIAGAFTNFFQKDLGPDHFFEFDISDVESLQEDKAQKADLAKKLLEAGWTVNEVRELFEKKPLDDPRADNTQILIESSTDIAASGNATPAPAEEPPPEEDAEAQQLALMDKFVGDLYAKIGTTPDLALKSLDEQAEGTTTNFVAFMLDTFVEMADAAVTAFKEEARKGQKQLPIRTKQDDDDPANIRSTRRLRAAIERSFDNLEETYIDDYVSTLGNSVEFGYDTQARFIFNPVNQDALTALRARDENRRRVILEARGLESFAQISKSHTERIMREITAGVEKNETINDISRRISFTFADPDKMVNRSRVIARTETLTAVSQGQWAAAQNAEEVFGKGKVRKQWVHAGDERVRDFHLTNQGLGPLPLNKAWPAGLKFPRDPAGPPEQVIQCRCTMIILPPGEEAQNIPVQGG